PVTQQEDSHSCGPIVMKMARLRMTGQAPPTTYDPESLRQEAIRVLRLAWSDGILCRQPGSSTGKRKRADVEPAKKRMKAYEK
ncbi:hypothetical protein JDV02_010559, partial [Purpureocillium takamizusanense]